MIRFVYFDVGGVSLLDFSGTDKWDRLQKSLGVTEENRDAFHAVWMRHRDRICIDCDVDSLLPLFSEEIGLEFDKEYSLLADIIERFEPNLSIWPVMNVMRRKSKVGLLTNMYPRMMDAILAKGYLPNIQWDTVIDSSAVRVQKPDPEIFAIAEKQSHTEAREILFIDNSPEHVSAAMARGWQTFLYDPRKAAQSSTALGEFYRQNA